MWRKSMVARENTIHEGFDLGINDTLWELIDGLRGW